MFIIVETAAVLELGHVFVPAKELGLVGWNNLVCQNCGIIRHKDGAKNECKGKNRIKLRNVPQI